MERGFESPACSCKSWMLKAAPVTVIMLGEIKPSLCESAERRLSGEFPIDKIEMFFFGQVVQSGTQTPDFLVETSTTYTLRYEDSTARVS